MVMKLVVLTGSRTPRREIIEVPDNCTTADLKRMYKPAMSEHRKSFRIATPPSTAAATSTEEPAAAAASSKHHHHAVYLDTHPVRSLVECGVRDGTEIVFKDLGPQVGYRTVFVVEYGGPIGIMALYALFPSFIYSGSTGSSFSSAQSLFIWLFLLHFVKRELETFFVHKFSRPTMPLRNIFKNCAYYWSFAVVIGYSLCHPKFSGPSADSSIASIAACLMVLFELGNFAVHVQLSSMRKEEGETTRNVPKGPLFALVSCPNYTFEILSWVAFSLGTGLWESWLFTFVGLAQMTQWALKKHKDYIKADPANRKKTSIIPFVV